MTPTLQPCLLDVNLKKGAKLSVKCGHFDLPFTVIVHDSFKLVMKNQVAFKQLQILLRL